MTRLAYGGWLLAALLFAALCIGRSMWTAFDAATIQDDARQHVFWMQRLTDPTTLRDDLFADYFASQAPPGYVLIFRLLLPFVDLATASKLLPPVLGLLSAGCTFGLVMRLYSSGPAAFLATAVNSWYVWQYDDLPTGSPRAFLLPLTTLLLLALAAGWRWWLVVAVVALEAVMYPSAAALGVVLVGLTLVTWTARGPRLTTDRATSLRAVACGIVALLLLAPTVFGSSPFGPAVSGAAARQMPEFGPGGRNAFFDPSQYQYWLVSYRSGFDLRVADRLFPSIPIFYELLALAGLLPLAALPIGRSRRTLGPTFGVLTRLIGASLILFVAAHLLLFKLYLPARFVAWSVPLAFAIAAGVGMTVLVGALAGRIGPAARPRVVGVVSVALAVGLALYPALYDGNFVQDRTPEITAYLRTLPVDTLVVGAPVEADSVPAFSGRRVLTNREYALAYHVGFYSQVQERTQAAIDAYYADTPQRLTEIAERYGIDVFLVNRAAFNPETAVDAWAGSFEPYTSQVLERARRGRRFALLDQVRRCGVLTEGEVTVVMAACIAASR
ncbi:MAG: hypothetical protein IT306_13160 [Chloroflexi bacterium]|nr:hypothetical protein [Chloroflexota bacterium]